MQSGDHRRLTLSKSLWHQKCDQLYHKLYIDTKLYNIVLLWKQWFGGLAAVASRG